MLRQPGRQHPNPLQKAKESYAAAGARQNSWQPELPRLHRACAASSAGDGEERAAAR